MPSDFETAPEIRILPGIGSLLGNYDGLILDLWGVVHDGRDPYPGVKDTLARVRDAGKRVVMLSNAPRRSDAVIEGMTAMGIDRGLYDQVLSSGELAWRVLKERTVPWAEALGWRCLHVGPGRDRGLLDGLNLEMIAGPERGGFVLNTGPWDDGARVADYEDLLSEAGGCAMPMICVNPDIEVIRAGARIICAGALAVRYAELGGTVHYFGKPYAETYAACLDVLAVADILRVLAVGDSLTTDIRGANAAGLDSVLVTSGIHASELGLEYGQVPSLDQLKAACAATGAFPTAAIPAFTW